MVLCVGDSRNTPLPDDSVDLIVTSPPYWSLRDYGIAGEIGGTGAGLDSLCLHLVDWCVSIYQ